jgi:NDP-sugar pyrophosphorylase family protein
MLQSVVLHQKGGDDERGRNLIFERSNSHFNGILSDDSSTDPYASINIFGKPLMIYNIEKLESAYGKIGQVSLPDHMPGISNQIARYFPHIQIDEYTETPPQNTDESALKVSMNSIVIKSGEREYAVSPIVYPWDVLKITEYILDSELKTRRISKDVSIESYSVIDGPCLIESGVSIDNFCKIKGPVYIGKDCKIGTGSLVRNSILGPGCVIGFSCEVARSYIAGQDTFPHYDAVLDSVVGEHTWMGGYVAITNVMLNNKEVKYKIDGKLVQTGLFHFGAVIGHHSTIGAAVVILPGRFMPPRSFIPPHVLYSSSEEHSPVASRFG